MSSLTGNKQKHMLWRCGGAVALVISILVLLFPLAATADSQQGTVAQVQIPQLPQGEMIFRFIDLVLPAGQPAVMHMHFAGFTYAVEGASTVSLDGKDTLLAQGQALWVPAQAVHTHGTVAGRGSHFWFVAVTPVALRGLAPVWPYPNAHIVGDTASFSIADTNPRNLALSEIRLSSPGDTVGSLSRNGPVGVAVIEGQVTVGGQVLKADGTTMQQQGATESFTNTGTGIARLLVFSVTPAGTTSPPAGTAPASSNTSQGTGAFFIRRLGDG